MLGVLALFSHLAVSYTLSAVSFSPAAPTPALSEVTIRLDVEKQGFPYLFAQNSAAWRDLIFRELK